MNTKDKTIQKNNNQNIKLFKIYEMFSRDLLFYSAISILFLTQIKNLTISQILLIESFYPLSKVIVQLFVTPIVDKISKKNSLIVGNIFVALFFIFMIISPNIFFCILANFFLALGYAFKEIAESTFVFDFIIASQTQKQDLYAKLLGKANSYYLIFYSISCITSGILFTINAYLPFICGLTVVLLATFIALFLKEPNNVVINTPKETSYIKELKLSFKYILNSNRLKLLLIFSAIFYSLISISAIYRISILEYLNYSSEYTGFLCALLACISAYASKNAHILHKNFKNTTLSYLSLGYCLTAIIISTFIYFIVPAFFMHFMVLIMMSLQSIFEGPYTPLINKYLNNFTTSKIRTKIYTVKSLLSEGIYAIITFISSLLLNIFSLPTTVIIIAIIFTLTFITLLSKMQNKVGLSPEKYKSTEIYTR